MFVVKDLWYVVVIFLSFRIQISVEFFHMLIFSEVKY